MQINMTTFAARREMYIDETIESLFASEWMETGSTLSLIMGSEDESHVERYRDHPSVRIVPWNLETNPNMRWNCTLNKIRALNWGEDGPMVICEDDIVFEYRWLTSLKRAAAELGDEEYVLSLFADKHLLAKSPLVDGKTLIRVYPTFALQGAQALYYPTRAMRARVKSYLTVNMKKGCGDDLIGRCAQAEGALYSTATTLVGNIGGVSCFH
jgi:hypothetical protein